MNVVIVCFAVASVAQAAAPMRPAPTERQDDVQLVGRYRLKPNGAGGYRWQGAGFTASIAADGSVRFESDAKLPSEVTVPVLAAAQAVKGLRPPPRPGGARPGAIAAGARRSDGPLGSVDQAVTNMVSNPTMVVSDEELRHDSHHAAKMSFLEETAKFRAGLRSAWDRKAASGALGQLRRTLRSIAADTSKPLADRHRLVFALWDECEDSPDGAAARAAIEEEAGRQFPQGTAQAFTVKELADLNAGQKRAPFSPYRLSSPSPAPR
jgi:hypothetical protein